MKNNYSKMTIMLIQMAKGGLISPWMGKRRKVIPRIRKNKKR